MSEKKKPVGFGVCEACRDEYDEPKEVPLYKVRGHLICGRCASEFEGDSECHEMAYGVD